MKDWQAALLPSLESSDTVPVMPTTLWRFVLSWVSIPFVLGLSLWLLWLRSRRLKFHRRIEELRDVLRQYPRGEEIAYVLNADGSDVFPAVRALKVMDDNTGRVNLRIVFSAEQLKRLSGRTIVHNHTTIAKSFSDSDVILFLNHGVSEIHAVTRNRCYTLRRPVFSRIEWKDVEKRVRELDQGFLRFYKTIHKGNLAFRRWHLIWQIMSDEFGLIYRVEDL